jgi:hypothetical protein
MIHGQQNIHDLYLSGDVSLGINLMFFKVGWASGLVERWANVAFL